MIPRTIHYIWLGGAPLPPLMQQCIASWSRACPGYDIRRWDETEICRRYPSPWLQQALAAKKWAFAADYVRFHIIADHGGIYLDTDMELTSSLDPYLDHECFVGKENSYHLGGPRGVESYLTSNCFGAIPHAPFIERCRSYYAGRRFLTSDDATLPPPLRYSMTLLSYIMSELAKQRGYNPSPLMQQVQHLDGLTVYPTAVFDPHEGMPTHVARHHHTGTWRDENALYRPPRHTAAWRAKQHLKSLLRRRGLHLVKLKGNN